MLFNLIIQSLKEFLIYIRNFDKSDLSALYGKLNAVISQAGYDKTVQDILKVLSGWMDRFNYYIGIGFWDLMVRIFKVIGVFLVWIFEGAAYLIKLGLSFLN